MATRRCGARVSTEEVSLGIWQFVRIMVRLEETAEVRGTGSRDRLYRAWRASWDEMDRELTRLGESDAGAFADLMMDHDIVLPLPRDQRGQLGRTIDEVIAQLSRTIAAEERDTERRRHLRFERTELGKLGKRIAPAGGSRK